MKEKRGRTELGAWGEQKAAEMLCEKGYLLMERNFRCRTGEVDLVMRRADQIVFVEVKTRSSCRFGLPGEAVTNKKRRTLRRTAMVYLAKNRLENCSMRIDVVELLLQDGRWFFRHLENAV